MFSKSCHYGLQAMLYIGLQYRKGKNVELNEIAISQDIPKHFLSKILQLLVKHKLLKSMKGPTGGFKLPCEPEEIRLIEIIDAIDGLDLFEQCGISIQKCDDIEDCLIHEEYKSIRGKVKELFEKTTLGDLTEDIKKGSDILNPLNPGSG